jgi:hypothetical protein
LLAVEVSDASGRNRWEYGSANVTNLERSSGWAQRVAEAGYIADHRPDHRPDHVDRVINGTLRPLVAYRA